MVHTSWTVPPKQSKGSVGAAIVSLQVGVYHALASLSCAPVWYSFPDPAPYRGNEIIRAAAKTGRTECKIHDKYFHDPLCHTWYIGTKDGKTSVAATHLDIARSIADKADTTELDKNSLF